MGNHVKQKKTNVLLNINTDSGVKQEKPNYTNNQPLNESTDVMLYQNKMEYANHEASTDVTKETEEKDGNSVQETHFTVVRVEDLYQSTLKIDGTTKAKKSYIWRCYHCSLSATRRSNCSRKLER